MQSCFLKRVPDSWRIALSNVLLCAALEAYSPGIKMEQRGLVSGHSLDNMSEKFPPIACYDL